MKKELQTFFSKQDRSTAWKESRKNDSRSSGITKQPMDSQLSNGLSCACNCYEAKFSSQEGIGTNLAVATAGQSGSCSGKFIAQHKLVVCR